MFRLRDSHEPQQDTADSFQEISYDEQDIDLVASPEEMGEETLVADSLDPMEINRGPESIRRPSNGFRNAPRFPLRRDALVPTIYIPRQRHPQGLDTSHAPEPHSSERQTASNRNESLDAADFHRRLNLGQPPSPSHYTAQESRPQARPHPPSRDRPRQGNHPSAPSAPATTSGPQQRRHWTFDFNCPSSAPESPLFHDPDPRAMTLLTEDQLSRLPLGFYEQLPPEALATLPTLILEVLPEDIISRLPDDDLRMLRNGRIVRYRGPRARLHLDTVRPNHTTRSGTARGNTIRATADLRGEAARLAERAFQRGRNAAPTRSYTAVSRLRDPGHRAPYDRGHVRQRHQPMSDSTALPATTHGHPPQQIPRITYTNTDHNEEGSIHIDLNERSQEVIIEDDREIIIEDGRRRLLPSRGRRNAIHSEYRRYPEFIFRDPHIVDRDDDDDDNNTTNRNQFHNPHYHDTVFPNDIFTHPDALNPGRAASIDAHYHSPVPPTNNALPRHSVWPDSPPAATDPHLHRHQDLPHQGPSEGDVGPTRDCPICRDAVPSPPRWNRVVCARCDAWFHPACLRAWTKQSRTCPKCRGCFSLKSVSGGPGVRLLEVLEPGKEKEEEGRGRARGSERERERARR